MDQKVKYSLIFTLSLSLTLPMFFDVFTEFFININLNVFISLILFFGFLMLVFIGKLIEIYGYNSDIIRSMLKHDVIKSFIKKDNKIIIWLAFLLTMIFEEFLFRYYLIGLLINPIQLNNIGAIIISSAIFSVYHIHTWFSYRNQRLLLIYLIYSFLLGLYNGYLLLTLGILPCIFIHFGLVYYLYYGIYKRYFE